MISVMRAGWVHPIGTLADTDVTGPALEEVEGCVYERVEFRNLRLSHSASLFLLQGASLQQLFTNVSLCTDFGDSAFDLLVFAEPPRLHLPPPMIPRVVLASLLERASYIKPEEVLHKLFLAEAGELT